MRRSLRHGLVTFIVIRQHSDTSNLAPDDRITEEAPSIQAEFHSQGSLAENALADVESVQRATAEVQAPTIRKAYRLSRAKWHSFPLLYGDELSGHRIKL
jgi:hypothetical protein